MARQTRKKGAKPRYQRKGKDFKKDELTNEAVKNSTNNILWYSANEAILRDAASIPFSWPTGNSALHYDPAYSNITTGHHPYMGVPGILSLKTVPTIGTCKTATHPVNVAAQSLYSFVRHANSGHTNYDASDLMIYLLAIANMYAYLNWCQRLYGYAMTYDQRNRYIPNDLIRVNNVDSVDLRNNLANFRFWINTIISKMASFAVPANIHVFSRMAFLYQDYYVEGTVIKDQLYQFIPDGFYKFDLDNDSKGMLKYVPLDRTNLMSVQDVIDFGENLFGAIWAQEDFGIMSGDILKAYGDNIIRLTSLPEAYVMVPKFDTMVLTQMKNARLLHAKGVDITQSGNIGASILTSTVVPTTYSTSDYSFNFPTDSISSSTVSLMNSITTDTLKDYNVLSVDTDNPTPEIIMEATRLKFGYDQVLGELTGMSTEFISQYLVTYEPGSDMLVDALNILDMSFYYCIEAFEYLSSFHYKPMFYTIKPNSSLATADVMCHFDVDNFAVLSNEDLSKLNEAAIINMFAVPSVAKVM